MDILFQVMSVLQAKNQAIDREYDAQKDIAKPFSKGKVEGEARWARR